MEPAIPHRPVLTVVIPCFNERETIRELVRRVREQPIDDAEIIVVDDGSQDGTRDLLPGICEEFAARLILHPFNQGKGVALRTGFAAATGDVVIVQDADLEYDPNEYGLVIEPILKGHADVVFGSRFMGGRAHRVVYFWHMVGNRVLTLLSNMTTNLNLTDMETCYKAFRRELLQSIRLQEERFGFEPEITAKVARAGARIYEVGISYYGRTYAEGKKIGWRDGFRAIYAILRYGLFSSAARGGRPVAARRSRPHGRLVVGLSLVVAAMVAAWNLATPGLYYDEMLFCNAAVGGPTDSFVVWRWHGIPVLLMDYIGALKSWLYAPLFAVVPVDPWSVRLPAILFGLVGGLLLIRSATLLFGRRAAAFAAPLILLDPTLLMHSRIDWGPTALMFLCRGLLLAGIAGWWRRGTPAGLWLAVIAAALGVFDKLNFLWIVAASAAAVIATAGPRLRTYAAAYPLVALAQAASAVVVLGIGSWRAAALVAAGLGPAAQGMDERLGIAARLLGQALVGGGSLHVVAGQGMAPVAWMLPAYAAVVVAVAIAWPSVRGRMRQREWLFVLAFTMLLAVAFAATKSAEGPHHAAVVAGLPGLMLSPLLAAAAARGRRAGPWPAFVRMAAIGSTAALAAGMLATSLVSLRAFASPANPNFDPAMNALATVAASRPEAVYRTCDWGLGTQLIGMTKGRIRVDDDWTRFQHEATALQVLESRDRSRDLILVVRADGRENFPEAARGLEAALTTAGLSPVVETRLDSVHGQPLITFLRIPRDEEPAVAAESDLTPPLVVHDWGPRQTVAGEGFSVQNDGRSAMWIGVQGLDMTAEPTVEIDGLLITEVYGTATGITFLVPDEAFATPGRRAISLHEGGSERTVRVGTFVVTPAP
jgi:glycosyltransferase involved in cell wall biosynthesis